MRDDRFGNNGNIHIIHEVEENLHFLLALAAGLVRGTDDDLLDLLVHDGLSQFLHIYIFLCQSDKGIPTVVHFFPLFYPFPAVPKFPQWTDFPQWYGLSGSGWQSA